jgi:tetratricopeptide (TPR) repeat protein
MTPETIAAGIRLHEAGQFARARDCYLQALAEDPQNADVLNLLGAVSINLEELADAERYLAEAVRSNPAHPAAYDNLGVLAVKLGRTEEAIDRFRRACELGLRNVHSQRNLAKALIRANRRAEALVPFERALELEPNSIRSHADLAKSLWELGLASESVEHFSAVARLRPDDPRAHFELGAALAACGRIDEAIAAYRLVLRLQSDSAEAHVNLSQLYADRRSYDEAASLARRAVELRPGFAEAYLNLGCALTKQEKFAEALVALEKAAQLKPELPEVYNNLGIVLSEEGQFDRAVANYRRALELRPRNAEVFYNLGIALHKQGEPRAAIGQFDRALELRPDYGEAHHNRASSLLLLGRMAEGFAEYEWRFRSRDFPAFKPRWPVWDGTPPLRRTIVLCAEQGLGDTLQFVRYAALLAASGARVVVECPAAMHAILARTPAIDRCITATEAATDVDYCLPLLSMPYRMGTALETIPREIPYVFADPARVEAWQESLARHEGLKVGIVWQGNPRCPGDRQRSIALECFRPLAEIEGVKLFSLQKGPGSEQLPAFAARWRVVDLGESLDSGGAFVDTAAIMKCLDLVITSDTAAAHLAGALGARVWVALPRVPDWRWLLGSEDSPWYPSMRLFRQANWGDWSEVFRRIAVELSLLAISV